MQTFQTLSTTTDLVGSLPLAYNPYVMKVIYSVGVTASAGESVVIMAQAEVTNFNGVEVGVGRFLALGSSQTDVNGTRLTPARIDYAWDNTNHSTLNETCVYEFSTDFNGYINFIGYAYRVGGGSDIIVNGIIANGTPYGGIWISVIPATPTNGNTIISSCDRTLIDTATNSNGKVTQFAVPVGFQQSLMQDSFNQNSSLVQRRINLTSNAPSTTLNGQNLGFYGAGGYQVTKMSANMAGIIPQASQDWTDVAVGTQWNVQATPRNSTTRQSVGLIDGDKNWAIGSTIATNATDGHIYIPQCAGQPTGAPRYHADGRGVALIVDSTNGVLYFYKSGTGWVAL